MFNAVIAPAALLALLTPSAVSPAVATVVPSESIVVNVINTSGSGCPPGTAAVSMSPDNGVFRVSYSDYFVQVGGGAKPSDARRNCQLTVQIHAPQGYTYSIQHARYQGYAYLEAGVTGRETATYTFGGSGGGFSHPSSRSFTGPMDDGWSRDVFFETFIPEWVPCGEQVNLSINTEIQIEAGTSTSMSFLVKDMTGVNISDMYFLTWQQC